jgi:hypothetical protein
MAERVMPGRARPSPVYGRNAQRIAIATIPRPATLQNQMPANQARRRCSGAEATP